MGKKVPLDVVKRQERGIIIPANRKITKTLLRKLASAHEDIEIDPSPMRDKLMEILEGFKSRFSEIDNQREAALDLLESGDDLGSGTIKQVKEFTSPPSGSFPWGTRWPDATGTKGWVATIVPEEDMPFLEDGTPVDICLNPLGVPAG